MNSFTSITPPFSGRPPVIYLRGRRQATEEEVEAFRKAFHSCPGWYTENMKIAHALEETFSSTI